MPYVPISNLSRRGEKIAPFLSIQNIIGITVVAAPIWLISDPAPGMLRFLLFILGAAAGYLITMDVRGMSLADRMVWLARGQVRSLLRGTTITPDDLPGTASSHNQLQTLLRDGAFRRRADGAARSSAPRDVNALIIARVRRQTTAAASPPNTDTETA